jgi:hypothetical protein
MRQVVRVLSTRYGVALIITVLVLAVVGVTRAVSGEYRAAPLAPATEPSIPVSTAPSVRDDSVAREASPAPPSTSPGAVEPSTVALDFTRAWLRRTDVSADEWRRGFEKYATPALMRKLKDADPRGVPAERTTGPVTLQNRGTTLVEAVVPVDSGTVRLRLLANAGRWLVDGVDWERT